MTPKRRLHRAAILAEGVDQLRGLALPILIAAVVGGGLDRFFIFGVIGIVLSIGIGFMQWQTTLWWTDEDSIRLRRGVFTERVTSVPLDRVQAIDAVRGPVQRVLGAVEVHVQTAGGGAKGEIVLKAVDPSVVAELRDLVGARSRSDVAPERPAGAAPTWKLSRRALMTAALTSGSLGVLVPVVAGASQVLDDVMGAEQAERLVPSTVVEALLAFAVVLLVAWVLSVLGTIIAFAGFTVVRDGDRLRISRGIIERRESSVPVARVAAVRIIESPLREPFGLAQVRLESAGYAKEPATAQALLPLVRRSEVDAVLRTILPELATAPAPLAPPPPRALRRYLLPPVLVAVLAPLVLLVVFGAVGLAAVALPLAAVLYGMAAYRAAGWRLDSDHLILRRRGLQRTTLIADAHRLPELFTRTTPFQRRSRLSNLGVAVTSGRRIAVHHLDTATTTDVLTRLTRLATAR